MMTAPSLLSSDVNHADGAPPAQSILHSAPDDSRRGDFQEFMGLAQAGQNATGSSSPSAPVLPPPSDPSDKSTPSAPSTPPQPTLDNSIAGLVLAMFAQPPKEGRINVLIAWMARNGIGTLRRQRMRRTTLIGTLA